MRTATVQVILKYFSIIKIHLKLQNVNNSKDHCFPFQKLKAKDKIIKTKAMVSAVTHICTLKHLSWKLNYCDHNKSVTFSRNMTLLLWSYDFNFSQPTKFLRALLLIPFCNYVITMYEKNVAHKTSVLPLMTKLVIHTKGSSKDIL